jgi:DNA-directed RNA polymerase subunit H (RpoH/RPB5)
MEDAISKLATINGYTTKLGVEDTDKITFHRFRDSKKNVLVVCECDKASKSESTLFIRELDGDDNIKAGVIICEPPKSQGKDVIEAGRKSLPDVTIVTFSPAQMRTAVSGCIFMPEVVKVIEKAEKMYYNEELIESDVLANSPIIKSTDPLAKLHLMKKGDVMVTKQMNGTTDSVGKKRLCFRVCK